MPEATDRTIHLADRFRPMLEAIASREPTPGGGAVAAWVGAIGTSLGSMVVAFSLGRDRSQDPTLRDAGSSLAKAQAIFMELGEEDAAAYEALSTVLKMKKSDPERGERLPGAVARAIEVPSIIAATALNALRVLEGLSGVCNPYLKSDLGVAAGAMEASVRGAAWMVRANLPLLRDESESTRLAGEVVRWLSSASSLRERVDAACAAPAG